MYIRVYTVYESAGYPDAAHLRTRETEPTLSQRRGGASVATVTGRSACRSAETEEKNIQRRDKSVELYGQKEKQSERKREREGKMETTRS